MRSHCGVSLRGGENIIQHTLQRPLAAEWKVDGGGKEDRNLNPAGEAVPVDQAESAGPAGVVSVGMVRSQSDQGQSDVMVT